LPRPPDNLMELVTPRLRIREFAVADFQAMRDLDSQPAMHTYEREHPSEDETRQTLEESIRNQRAVPRTAFRLAITVPPLDTVRGVVKLARQWEAIREWEIGWAVHPDEWGKGNATEAAWFMLDWGFRELNIHRVVAYCHALNAASVRVMEKLGMHQDGRLRETRWLNGTWWDEFVYSILDKDWKTAKNPVGLS
jgi:RimJ/RimL family protein N-acetyltransferase